MLASLDEKTRRGALSGDMSAEQQARLCMLANDPSRKRCSGATPRKPSRQPVP